MKKVIAYLQTHWDREWYRDFEDFRIRLINVVDNILNLLEQDKIPSFYFDGQTAAIEDYLEIYPEKISLIKKFIQEKKLFIGPFYCLSDVFLVSRESLLRNLLFGIKKSKELGCCDFIGYLADTFGHSKSVPSIFSAFNIDNVVMWRGLPDLPAEFCWFNMKAVNLLRGYFHDYFSSGLPFDKKMEFLKLNLDMIAKGSSEVLLLPVGGDHLGVPCNIKEQIEEANKVLKDYQIELGSPFDYLQLVKDNFNKKVITELRDNSKTFILPGIYSCGMPLKILNNAAQWKLSRVAEPLQAVASCFLGQKSMQNECNYAFKTLIKNHAHDSIYGCSIDNIYDEMTTRFKKVDSVANSICNHMVYELSDETGELSVLNLSNFSYSGAVEVESAKPLDKIYRAQKISSKKGFSSDKIQNTLDVPITEDFTDIKKYLIDLKDLPAFSLNKITAKNIQNTTSLKISENSIENDFVKLEVSAGKINIEDKLSGKIYTDFINIIDRKDVGDSYNFAPESSLDILNFNIVNSKIEMSGNIRSVLRIRFEAEFGKKQIIDLYVILENQSKTIKFEAKWVNKSKNHILQVLFNKADVYSEIISEDTTGLIKRKFNPDYKMEIPAPKGVELKTNTAPFQRFFCTNDFGVLTKGLQEYEVFQSGVALTILRSVGIISNPKNPARGTPAGPPLPVEKMQVLDNCSANFALNFEKSPSKYFEIVENYYNPSVVIFRNSSDLQFFNSSNKNIIADAIKLDDKGDLIVRFVNMSDKKEITELKSPKKIFETDIFEQKKELCPQNITFNQFEIKTFRFV